MYSTYILIYSLLFWVKPHHSTYISIYMSRSNPLIGEGRGRDHITRKTTFCRSIYIYYITLS